MAKIINLKQQSPEWHEFRQMKIGASDASCIMGVNPWKTALQLWEEKINGNNLSPSHAMIRGAQLESQALAWFNNHMNQNNPFKGYLSDAPTEYKPTVMQSENYPWMIASLDGYLKEGCICEIKCPGIEAHMQALDGIVPDYYIPQLQHQMAVANCDSMLYISYDGENGVVIEVKRDQDYIDKLIEAEKVFWLSLVELKSPEPTDRDMIEIVDLSAKEAAKRYVSIQEHIKLLEKEAEDLKKTLIGYAKHGKAKVGNLRIVKVISKGSIDYEKLMKEYKIFDAENFRKESRTSWRLSVKE